MKIHGKISNPIFGISENDNDNILAHRFTKPKRWRLNEAFQPLYEFLRFRVNNIVFYGTSLNDLDFDHYYWLIKEFCNARIFFCFTEYDENFPQKEIHDDMVENLISKIFKTNFQHLSLIHILYCEDKKLSEYIKKRIRIVDEARKNEGNN